MFSLFQRDAIAMNKGVAMFCAVCNFSYSVTAIYAFECDEDINSLRRNYGF